jgi:hypothetical protein
VTKSTSSHRLPGAAASVVLACAAALSLAGSATAQPAVPHLADPAAATAVTTVAASSKTHVPSGYDISWPNCPKGMGIPSRPTQGNPMPSTKTDFVVIGLTNGPGFYPNPCLKKHVDWAKKHHVRTAPYAFMTYPTAKQLKKYGSKGPYEGTSKSTRLRNAGYAEAMFNVASMKKVDLEATFIWIDVEYSRAPAPWSKDKKHNKAALDGALRAYRDSGLTYGFYASIDPWQHLVGNARYHAPEWRTVGPVKKSTALAKCRTKSVQGGKVVLAQWWNSRSDFDLVCPGFRSEKQLGTYFHQY